MATFQYTPTQNMVRSTPVAYNVQPNMTVARGIDNLTNAISGAMKLKTQIDQDNFNQQQLDQKNTLNQFSADWDAAPYEQQQEMIKELPALILDKYQGDDKYSQQLRANGIQAISQFESALGKTAKQVEHNNFITQQNVAFLDAGNNFNETQDIAGKRKIVNVYYESNVAPYEGIDDPKAQELYNRGLENWTKLDSGLRTVVRQRADNKITTDVMTSLQVELQMNGHVSADRYKAMKENLARRSDWADKQTEIMKQFDGAILMGMRGMFNDPNTPRTAETANLYMQRVQDFVKTSPNLIGTPAYNDAIIFGNTLKNAADNTDMASMQAQLVDDTVSPAAFKSTLSDLQSRNLLTEEQVSSLAFRKKENVTARNVTPSIANMVQTNDYEGLKQMYKDGHGGTVDKVIRDSMSITFSQVRDQYGTVPAATNALQQFQKYSEAGLTLGNIDFINEQLKMPQTGFTAEQDVRDFLEVYRTAAENGYRAGMSPTVTQNYTILSTWAEMGMPDMVTKWNTYKSGQLGIRVADSDVEEAFQTILDSDDTFSENLANRNLRAMSDVFKPAIRAALKAGIDIEDLKGDWEPIVDATYLRPDPSWGGSSEVLIRTSDIVPDENAYLRAYKIFEALPDVKAGVTYFAPREPNKPTGDWVLWDKNGDFYVFPSDIVKDAARGIAPK